MRTDILLRAAAGSAAFLLAGCVTPVDRVTPPARHVGLDAIESARVFGPEAPGMWPQARWWAGFGDAQLDALVDEALASHPTLRVAQARFAQASALVEAAVASASPGVTGGLDVMHQRFSVSGTVPPPVAGTTRTTARMAMDFSYELDFANRNEAAIAAARAAEAAAGADAQAARLALTSGMARAYFQLQALFAQRSIAGRELEQSLRKLALVRQRVAAGLETEAELGRAGAVPPGLRASAAQLDAAIALARNQLAALAGQGPDRGLGIAPSQAGARSAGAPGLPPALPLDLLGRRPDLVAARWRVEAAAGEVEVARKRFLPNVNLIAFAGVASLGLDRLLAAGGGIGGVGPAVRLPLFSAGGLQAGLRGREADYDLAVERYNELLLEAVREVADQVQVRRVLETERAERRLAKAASEQARRVAIERYNAGIANFLEVLDAEAPLYALQRLEADLSARALLAEVGLYRALGGGYEDAAKTPR
jgi:NodT family efflux transporter outer membrane factor (OMF) lipoprotein